MAYEADHEKYEIAAAVAILGYDLHRVNATVPTLLADNTLDQLAERREELLITIDEQVSLDGFYEVPDWMDADWLATQLQTEFGSYVAAGTHQGAKAIVLADPS